MRVLIVIVVVVLLLSLAGWVVFDFSGNSASVEIRKDKIQRDTDNLIDNSKDLLRKAEGQPTP